MHKCNHCGTDFEGKFCPNCGTEYRPKDGKLCPNCGATVEKDAKFCTHCGYTLDGTVPSKPVAPVKPADQVNPNDGQKGVGIRKHKKAVIVLSILVVAAIVLLCLIPTFKALGTNGTYYIFENGDYDKSDYLVLKNGKWIDSDDESGTYKIDGENITLYIEFLGNDEELCGGTISNGVITINFLGFPTYYCKEGKVPEGEHLHSYTSEGIEPTCTETGVKTYTCTVCGKTETKTVAALGHNYVNGVCTRCGAKESSTDQRKYILFGSYPQSEVTDSATLANLTWEDAQTTMLPTSTNANGWTDYGYYISGSVSSYMWYKDVSYSGDKYRAVYFTSYRPYNTGNSSSTRYTYQDDNGYYVSTVYWFKYEPIKWRILEESDGTAFLMADIMLDSQQYYHQASSGTTSRTAVANYNDDYYAGNGTTVTASVYDNNYLYSEIRSWLNETFYETAFTEYEKQLVQTTLVDNSAAPPTSSMNSYACANTNDKVFLLSEYEVTIFSYGFSPSWSSEDTARQLKSTAYAKSQGCFAVTSTDSSYLGNGSWRLRSPYDYYSSDACYVNSHGDAYKSSSVSSTSCGVVPALHIRLS